MPENQGYLLELGKYLTIMVCFVTVGATIVGSVAFYRAKNGQAKTFSLLVQRANALQMATVGLIILGVCSLRILNDITSEGVISILSGIAGYVLGARPQQSSERDSPGEQLD